jgi:hypothetical protein
MSPETARTEWRFHGQGERVERRRRLPDLVRCESLDIPIEVAPSRARAEILGDRRDLDDPNKVPCRLYEAVNAGDPAVSVDDNGGDPTAQARAELGERATNEDARDD